MAFALLGRAPDPTCSDAVPGLAHLEHAARNVQDVQLAVRADGIDGTVRQSAKQPSALRSGGVAISRCRPPRSRSAEVAR
ncbi:hypothetical protein AWB68_07248 [Caballeronia choica]|jgi:hypothetical protein|uniref:Uncharacterized protein n=1 Tax=Caballeronia choica TaxID=326476 RepID=A0A158KT35_9BURK|nr:hypothetical protein AWB68_07248 [Caballeronia choica]